MGTSSSRLVECVEDGDVQALHLELQRMQEEQRSETEVTTMIEQAVHAALGADIDSVQHLQQLQIAVEMLLRTKVEAIATSTQNTQQWTALHRLCAAGNLAFVPFLFEHYNAELCSTRDVFGLYPIDLVPPELLATQQSIGQNELRVEFQQRMAALEMLRQSKRVAQARVLQSFVMEHASPQYLESKSQATSEQRTTLPTALDWYVKIEPRNDHLATTERGSHQLHQLDLPLRVHYRLPRISQVSQGYFQVLWRGIDDECTDEPQYDLHWLMRDEMDLDPAPTAEDIEEGSDTARLLQVSPTADALTGGFPLNVSHLPDSAICHVLFIACGKGMMKRQVLLSSEGMRLQAADPAYGLEAVLASEQQTEGFSFYVAGEEFTHVSEDLAGQVFDTVDEFHAFIKQLRATRSRSGERRESKGSNEATTSKTEETRPSELTKTCKISTEIEEEAGEPA